MDVQKFLTFFKQVNKYDEFNGLQFEYHSPGSITYRMTIQEKHLSSPNITHGAAIAGMMDCVLGLSALSLAITKDNLVSTVEFKVNYTRPVALGEELTGHGNVVHIGKRLVITAGELRNKAGELVAMGQGTFNIYPASKKDFLDEIK
jgi:uncharacterized protein (TIGR00369 family)